TRATRRRCGRPASEASASPGWNRRDEVTGLLRVGLLGCGNVGAAVARMLHEHAEDIERRAGVRIEVTRVAVRDPSRPRDVPVPPERFTDRADGVVADPGVDVVVEVIGGIEPARSLILAAF